MVKRTIVAASLLLAFATPAAAAEGGLEIFPDLVKILAEGGNPLGSHFLQLIALFLVCALIGLALFVILKFSQFVRWLWRGISRPRMAG